MYMKYSDNNTLITKVVESLERINNPVGPGGKQLCVVEEIPFYNLETRQDSSKENNELAITKLKYLLIKLINNIPEDVIDSEMYHFNLFIDISIFTIVIKASVVFDYNKY